MKVITAILISCCIPILFTPIKYKRKLWIDGGVLNNYPINYFSNDIKNTLGIAIYDKCHEKKNHINNIVDYYKNLYNCIIYGYNDMNIYKYKDNTITFNHYFNSTFNFSINKEFKNNYFDLGYQCAKKQRKKLKKFY